MTSIFANRNYGDFSSTEITSKKARRNDIDFSPIEITSKKYVDIFFTDILFSTYWRNIDIESTSIRRVVSVEVKLFCEF